MLIYLLAGAAFLAADQGLKAWITANLPLGEGLTLIPGFLELRTVHNYGAAFSSFSGMRYFLLLLTCAIVAAVGYLLVKKIVRHPLGRWAGTAILAGGLGNIIDRLRLGYVVDMFNFQFINYPVFNVADICVVGGTILAAIYYLWYYEKYDLKKDKNHGNTPPSSDA